MSRQGLPGNYLQTSPVRGQLEPFYDGGVRTGWRFLQCTDTPNELKVLLPPRTALLYANLIRAEQSELAKPRVADWERITRIRHLKDRMIRKCMRLARVAPPKQTITFRTVHAPSDFRLKELEKWLKEEAIPIEQDSVPPVRRSSLEIRGTAPKTLCDCNMCRDRRASQNRPMSQSPKPVPRSQRSSYLRTYSARSGTPRRQSTALSYIDDVPPEPSHQTDADRAPYPIPVFTNTNSSAERIDVRSPQPVPHPYMHEELNTGSPYFSSTAVPDVTQMPVPQMTIPVPETMQMPVPEMQMPVPETMQMPVPQTMQMPVPEIPGYPPQDDTPRPGISRRRSSLKQANGPGRLSNGSAKSVAWAMDRDWLDQIARYETAICELEGTGNEVEEIKASYRVQMGEIRGLRKHVSDSLARLQREVDRLRLSEDMMRGVEDRIRSNFEALQEKQSQYLTNVDAVIEESKRVVDLCGKKRTDENS